MLAHHQWGLLLHPWNLTWNLKRSPWKRKFLLETIIFRFHVQFRGCNCCSKESQRKASAATALQIFLFCENPFENLPTKTSSPEMVISKWVMWTSHDGMENDDQKQSYLELQTTRFYMDGPNGDFQPLCHSQRFPSSNWNLAMIFHGWPLASRRPQTSCKLSYFCSMEPSHFATFIRTTPLWRTQKGITFCSTCAKGDCPSPWFKGTSNLLLWVTWWCSCGPAPSCKWSSIWPLYPL